MMYTLKDLILKIKDIASKIPNVNSFYQGDVYQLNENADVKYSACVVSQGQHVVNMDDFTVNYNLIIFIIDRQTSDADNVLDVQSHSIDVLNTIATELNKICIIEDYTIDTFKERFSSLCAGAFMRIGIELPMNDLCE